MLKEHLAEYALHGFQVTLAAAPREHHDLRPDSNPEIDG